MESDDLDRPTADVERVITQETAKVFKFEADLGLGVESVEGLTIKGPVSVMSEDGRLIGAALLEKYNNTKILASVTIDYNTEERLLIESQSIPMYLLLRDMTFHYTNGVRDSFEIQGLTVSQSSHLGPSAKPIGHGPILWL